MKDEEFTKEFYISFIKAAIELGYIHPMVAMTEMMNAHTGKYPKTLVQFLMQRQNTFKLRPTTQNQIPLKLRYTPLPACDETTAVADNSPFMFVEKESSVVYKMEYVLPIYTSVPGFLGYGWTANDPRHFITNLVVEEHAIPLRPSQINDLANTLTLKYYWATQELNMKDDARRRIKNHNKHTISDAQAAIWSKEINNKHAAKIYSHPKAEGVPMELSDLNSMKAYGYPVPFSKK